MSHRFVRCPHCKMPHEANERVCPATGLPMPVETRPAPKPVSPPPRAGSPRRKDGAPSPPPRASPRKDAASNVDRDEKRDLVGMTLGDRYRIKGMLGQGGMGTVYDAEHLGLGREVAVKVLSPSQAKKRVAVKRFQQEARAAGAIGHPNICEVYDLGILDDGSPYLVMEKLVGQTLSDRIAKEGGLPFEDVIEIVGQVLSGLVAAHEKGIVHRDIKPENIFLARRVGCPPIIKLLDFGVSKMMAEFNTGEADLDLTRTGMVMGTPYYMSPEQARGERNLDGRVDVYACGVVMYEACAGKRPFIAPNYNALLLAIINTIPRPLRELRPSIPPELEAIIAHAMERIRDARYPSAKHLLAELVPRTPPRTGRRERVPMPPPVVATSHHRPPVGGDFDGQTRIERGARGSAPDAERTRTPSRPEAPHRASSPDDSIDIPIHVTGPIDDDDDDMPTEIFRPGERAGAAQPSSDWDSDTIVEHADAFRRMFDDTSAAGPEPVPREETNGGLPARDPRIRLRPRRG